MHANHTTAATIIIRIIRKVYLRRGLVELGAKLDKRSNLPDILNK